MGIWFRVQSDHSEMVMRLGIVAGSSVRGITEDWGGLKIGLKFMDGGF